MPNYKYDENTGERVYTYDENTGERVYQYVESPEEMRKRAKTEYAADVMRQRMEYDKENPIKSVMFPRTAEAVKSNAPMYTQGFESAMDVYSGPGRLVMKGIEYLNNMNDQSFEDKQQMQEQNPKLMGVYNFAKDVVESPINLPLLPIAGIGAGTKGMMALAAGLGRIGATAGLVGSDIASEKSVHGQEMTPADYGIALASGLLPEGLPAITKGIRYAGQKLQPMLESAAIFEKYGNHPLFKGIYEPTGEGGWLDNALLSEQQKAAYGVKIGDAIKRFAGNILGIGAGAATGGVIGGGVGATAAAGLGGHIGDKLAQAVTLPALESAAFRASQVQPFSQTASTLVAPHIVPRQQPDVAKYNADLIEAMRNNLLTESEYRAYQNPANMQRFYQRFQN